VKNEGTIMKGTTQSSGNRWRCMLHGEPSIKELLDDPVIEAIMVRDGVRRKELESLIADVRGRLERHDGRNADRCGLILAR
jgi:hypothetical protein